MGKKVWFYFLIFILVFYYSCENAKLKGTIGVSQNILESKEREVFVCKYQVEDDLIIIHDKVIAEIEELRLERQWRYGKKSNQTIITASDEGYQLKMNLKSSKHLKEYEKRWFIGIDTRRCFRFSGRNSLMSDLDSLPSDTISYLIQSSKNLSPKKEMDVIGKLVFVRVND